MHRWFRLGLLSIAASAVGCSREARPAAAGPVPSLPYLPPRPSFDPNAAPPDANGPQITLTGPLVGALAAREEGLSLAQRAARAPVHRFFYGAPAAFVPSFALGVPAIDQAADTAQATKVEVEVQLALQVRDVPSAAAAILGLVRDCKGFVSKDERTSGAEPNASLLARVPAATFDAFMDALGHVGDIKNLRKTAVDAALENKDVDVLVANLESAQTRYRELLQRTTDPAQVLAVEREQERVRTELDRIRARQDLLRDRATYATVAIGLHTPPLQPDIPAGYQPVIATGVRGLSLVDVRESGTSAYLGTGLSLRFPRSVDSGRGWALDVDVLRSCCGSTPARSDWAYDVLLGLDLFSESLGGGRQRWLNPFLGLRLGVAQTQDRLDFAAAAVLGLEVIKSRVFVLEAEMRLVALVGDGDGPHGGVQPIVGVGLGF
jgi:hypothetical protein